MKKIVRYMEKTALSYSQDRDKPSYNLEPKGTEPHQRKSKTRQHHQYHAEKRSSIPSAHSHSLPAYSSGACGPYPIPAEIQRFQYGTEHILQSVEVYLPQGSPEMGSLKERSSEDSGEDGAPTNTKATTANGNVNVNGHAGKHDTLAPPAYTPTPTPISSPLATGTHTPQPKYWILYLHGGYFRDPNVSASSFHPALAQLINPHSPSPHIREIQPHIAGYASINYRLAPHKLHPQRDDVPRYERREAQWPEMQDDVSSAIAWLQGRYGFGERYLLVGHSVGATMGVLTCLRPPQQDRTQQQIPIPKPLAVLGICGIYDFPALHRHWGAEYEALTRNAGIKESMYQDVSPAHYSVKEFENRWARGRKRWLILAQSRGDDRVEWAQVEGMAGVFEGESDSEREARGSAESARGAGGEIRRNGAGEGQIEVQGLPESNVLVDVVEVQGKHDEVWKKGGEVAKVVALAVGEMMGLDQ